MSPELRPRRSAAVRALAQGIACALSTLVAGCGSTLSLRELDRLNRSTESRTIVLESDFSLYSPFSAVGTLDYRGLAGGEIEMVVRLFELELSEPIPVFLHAVEGMRPRVQMTGSGVFSVDAVSEHPMHGIEGLAGRDLVVVYVEPPMATTTADGKRVEGAWSAEEYRGTLRHELVHYCAGLAGLDGDLWFSEGLAHAVQFGATSEGEEVLVRTHAGTRATAARVPVERRGLARVLAAREDVPAIQSGDVPADPEPRLLATSFVYFLLERAEGKSFVERVRALRALSREELLALEPAWQEWLAAALPRLAASAARAP